MPSTVPLSHHHNFGIRDKGDPRKESKRAERERAYYFEKHTKESPGSINSPKRIELPGPPIRIKGLPRLEYSTSYLLLSKTYLSRYA
jgi:hypothetical protein